MGYDWNFRFLQGYQSAFLGGAWITIKLSVLSFAIGTFGGIPAGIALRYVWGSRFLVILNDALRAVPVFVLVLFAYYFPYNSYFPGSVPGPFACAVTAISLSQAAYTAELVRTAIDGVPRKAILAGQALGLRETQILRYVILPDILRQILPAEIAFFIGIIRISSVAAVIGCEEVVFVARLAVSQNFRSLEAWIAVTLIYVVIVVPITVALRRLEHSPWLKRRM